MAARIAMMAMTTRSSMRVKADWVRVFIVVFTGSLRSTYFNDKLNASTKYQDFAKKERGSPTVALRNETSEAQDFTEETGPARAASAAKQGQKKYVVLTTARSLFSKIQKQKQEKERLKHK